MPYQTRTYFNRPRIRFSPDGRQLLLLLNAGREGEEAWLLPYPPDGARSPTRVLEDLPEFGGTPSFDWWPDNRHIVLSLLVSPDATPQRWLADTESSRRYALTSGTSSRSSPAVSRDGQRLIFSEASGNDDVVSVDLATANVQALIATERSDLMPAWAAAEKALVYVTDRSGPTEIWLHRPGVPDRPVVTARDFPSGPTQWFMAPALSPRADRVIYSRTEAGASPRLWISSVAGGSPIQLNGIALMKVSTSGQATPVVLKEGNFMGAVPAWSPDGNWIAHGNDLISPDGKSTKSLGNRRTPQFMFSKDGRLVYGLRPEGDQQALFSIDIASGAERTIGTISSDFTPGSYLGPSIRFSLAPDGKSFVYANGRFKTNLWMLDGFAQPRRWFPKLLR